MPRCVLVTPSLEMKQLDIDIAEVTSILGGGENDRLHVAFVESGLSIAALYSSDARRAEHPAPNPLASMGRNESDTGNSRFLSDPARAIIGPVVFIGEAGQDLTDEEIASIERGIQAVQNYRDDEPEEYRLWHDAAINIHRIHESEAATDEA